VSPEDRDALRQQLIAHEGLRLRVYADSVGKLTIGCGRNLTDDGISQDEAMLLLDHDISATLDGLLRALPWTAQLDAPRLRVLADIGFNAGIEGLLRFRKMLDAVERRDYGTAADEVIHSQLAPNRAQRLAVLMRS
jgi:lysozyme